MNIIGTWQWKVINYQGKRRLRNAVFRDWELRICLNVLHSGRTHTDHLVAFEGSLGRQTSSARIWLIASYTEAAVCKRSNKYSDWGIIFFSPVVLKIDFYIFNSSVWARFILLSLTILTSPPLQQSPRMTVTVKNLLDADHWHSLTLFECEHLKVVWIWPGSTFVLSQSSIFCKSSIRATLIIVKLFSWWCDGKLAALAALLIKPISGSPPPTVQLTISNIGCSQLGLVKSQCMVL